MKKRSFISILLAAAMTVSAVGCGTSQNNSSTTVDAGVQQGETDKVAQAGEDAFAHDDALITEKPDGIQPGTEFTYWINTDYPSHLPWMDNTASQLQIQVYDNLLYKYHGDPNDVRGNIAESWEVSEDGLTWVFKLKEDVTFTNGNKVTAEAFVKTWDVARNYRPNFFEVVDKYEATDEYELTITLKVASPTFIYDLPTQHAVGVVDPSLLEKYGPESNEAAVGCGPYMIEEYVSGEGFTLKANPNYHNPDRAPSIETCKLEIVPDINTAMVGLMGGQLDCMNTSDMEIVNSLEANGWEPVVWEARVHPWWFNAREVEIFQDAAVREGLCHMIDWEAVNQLVYDGRYMTMESYWDDGPGSYPYGEGYTYNPELGIKLIEDAGYSKDDIAFTIECNPDFAGQVTAIVAQFTELGFKNITMETYDMSTCMGMIQSGTYHVTTTHNGYSLENPLVPYSMGLSPEGTQPIIWLKYMNEEAYNEAMDHYNKAKECSNFEDYAAECSEITRICQENYCALGGLHRTSYYAVNPDFSGIYIVPVMGYLEFCYLYSNVG